MTTANENISLGSLFTSDFLTESITQNADWDGLTPTDMSQLLNDLRNIYAAFPTARNPNEAQTEDDLIWPILARLGWRSSLRQQNLAARGRDDVPDGLLFADDATKTLANAHKEDWRRYGLGLAIVESKRWARPLDRRSGRRGEETAPSTQMLRYLRRVDDLTTGNLRWGILTNGGRWRLYYSGAQSVSEQFFEIDLPTLLGLEKQSVGLPSISDETRNHWLKVFALIFRREAFLPSDADRRTFHQRALDEGQFYEERVTDSLSSLVFRAVFPTLAKGIAKAAPEAPLQEVREATLILLYRLLFILYAEDRNLLPVRDARYDDYGLRKRVRGDIGRRKDNNDTFSDTAARYWAVLTDLCRAIDGGDRSIGLPPYNGGLFNEKETPLLSRIRLPDTIIADVIDKLSFEHRDGTRKYINYRDLSVQQLGSIYERLLEHEIVKHDDGLVEVRPNTFARKNSGSYYTPDAVVSLILAETLEPLIAERFEAFRSKSRELSVGKDPEERRLGAIKRLDPAERLLELKICDPAMGSGHFLVSLVDYLADQVIAAMAEAESMVEWAEYVSPLGDRIEAIRNTILGNADDRGWTVDSEQLDDRHIIRRMILKRCVYGVDKNVMAVELAKVALWLHSFTVGAPLSFLDHHLRCGDSLFGSWVQNGVEKAGTYGSPLLLHEPLRRALRSASSMQIIEGLPDAEIAEAHRSADIFDEIQEMTAPLKGFLSLIHALDWLDLKGRQDKAVLSAFFDGQFGHPVGIAVGTADPVSTRKDGKRFAEILQKARELIAEQDFLHWQVAFPGVWSEWENEELNGGFDAIIGNPPWDRMKLQEVEWFAARRPEIALAQRKSDRATMVAALIADEDPLAAEFSYAAGRAETATRMARSSGEYPLLSKGDINLYSLFVERAQKLIAKGGMIGLLTPIGIGTDKTAATFFSNISEEKRVKTFIAFENKQGWLFKDVHHEDQPTVMVMSGEGRRYEQFDFAVKLTSIPERGSPLLRKISSEDCRRVNPNTGTVPIFRQERAGDLAARIYDRFPILVDLAKGKEGRVWPVKYATMFHMTNASYLFRNRTELDEREGAYSLGGNTFGSPTGRWLPLYEGKMISIFNHRYAGVRANLANVSGQGVAVHSSLDQLADPDFRATPRYWVQESEITYPYPYALAFNDICNTNNQRSLISALVPKAAYGNKLPILVPEEILDARSLALLLGNFNAILCDFIARQKIQSRNLNKYILEQLPVIPPSKFDDMKFGKKSAGQVVCEIVLELTYTAHDMAPFAYDMGYVDKKKALKPPFIWNEDRRLHLRAKLDAVFFHLYEVTDRDDVRYVYSRFPIVEREEINSYGGYRSCELCLSYMNALSAGHPDADVKG